MRKFRCCAEIKYLTKNSDTNIVVPQSNGNIPLLCMKFVCVANRCANMARYNYITFPRIFEDVESKYF